MQDSSVKIDFKVRQNYKIVSFCQNYIVLVLHLFYFFHFFLTFANHLWGGLAQLARACGWQPQGQGFDSPNLHKHNLISSYEYANQEGFIINLLYGLIACSYLPEKPSLNPEIIDQSWALSY